MKTPSFFGLHARPSRWGKRLLGLLPFLFLIGCYLIASDIRLEANPSDKLLPSVSHMADTMERMAFQPNKRTGDYLFWKDTLASLQRLFLGVALAISTALLIGLNIGIYPGFRATLNPVINFISMVPPLAILPILFILLGIEEVAKVTLIFIGTMPILTRDIILAVKNIPVEQKVKSLTLGASSGALIYRIILPQILPRAIDSLRLVLGGAWLFLIAAEAIAATEGLGYRIFLVRRYLAMDVIIPYVIWITLLGFTLDFALRWINQTWFRWYEEAKTQ